MSQTLFDRKTVFLSALLFHLLFWFYYAVAVHQAAPLHQDMLEAYFWGQFPSLGYYKHPPFWAWVAGYWFTVFPVKNWAFVLLCSLNATLALAGIWRVLSRFAEGMQRELAFLLLLFTSFYTFTAFQFNANTIFLSLWPWTLVFFLNALERGVMRDSILFGVFGAFMLLSKYSAIFLLLACLGAAFVHKRRHEYFRSYSPWLSIAVIVALCLPHLVWLFDHEFQPLTYVEGRLHNSFAFALTKAGQFLVDLTLQHSLVIGFILFALRSVEYSPIRSRLHRLRDADKHVVLVLAFAPSLLILVSGLASSIKLSSLSLIHI